MSALPYLINDADEHSTPALDAYERYIDPDKRAMAIRVDHKVRGIPVMSYNGRPARFTFENYQVVGSNEQLADVGVQDPPLEQVIARVFEEARASHDAA